MSIDLINLSTMLGASLIAVESLMLLLWIISLFKNRIGLIDIGWGLGFIFTTGICFILGNGYIWRKWLILFIVLVWVLRLVHYVLIRTMKEGEDPRYIQLFNKQNPLFGNITSDSLRALCIYLLQGGIVVILSVPFALICDNTFIFFKSSEVLGLMIWMIGFVGETIADGQLFRFKQNSANTFKVCESGLWGYSRHPNYFFEWVIWIGYSVLAYSAPGGWFAIISPLLMLYLLIKVSGIPLAEEEALKTKGDAYKEYQEKTSPFFLWFKGR